MKCCQTFHDANVVLQIVNGSFYLVGPTPNFQGRSRNIQHQVMELHRKFELPDVDFVLVTSDRCKTGEAPHISHDGNMTRCERLVSHVDTALSDTFFCWLQAISFRVSKFLCVMLGLTCLI